MELKKNMLLMVNYGECRVKLDENWDSVSRSRAYIGYLFTHRVQVYRSH